MRRHLNQSIPNDSGTFLPAEWRWQSHSICDNKWHHYVIQVDYPNNIELIIDGQHQEATDNNPVIVDDLPLHDNIILNNNNNNHNNIIINEKTVFTLGACWDGKTNETTGYFKGFLSALMILPNKLEQLHVIECINRCAESLVSLSNSEDNHNSNSNNINNNNNNDNNGQIMRRKRNKLNNRTVNSNQQSINQIDYIGIDGDKNKLVDSNNNNNKIDNSLVSYQLSSSEIILNGHDLLDLKEALSRIAYVNYRDYPSLTTTRTVNLITNINCLGNNLLQGEPSAVLIDPINIDIIMSQLDIDHDTHHHNTYSNPYDNYQQKLKLELIGTMNLAQEYNSFIKGIDIFSSVSIRKRLINNNILLQDKQQNQSDKAPTNTHPIQHIEDIGRLKIESCLISIYPPLNDYHESLILPKNLLNESIIYWKQSNRGAIIYGKCFT